MENLKSAEQRPVVRQAAMQAERWAMLRDANSALARYTQLTENLIERYPRSYQEEKDLMKEAAEIQKEQTLKACKQIEGLFQWTTSRRPD